MKLKFDLYSRANQLIIDSCIFTISFAAAYLIRFDGVPSWTLCKQFLLWFPYLIAARLLVNWKQGIYRFIWRYVSLSDALAIGQSLSVVTAVFLGLRLFYPDWAVLSFWVRLPLSVIALEFFLSLTGSLGARALRRILYERQQRSSLSQSLEPRRVILYGAGRAGILLLKELRNHGDVEVSGFVDDDPKKLGAVISGVKVLGGREALETIVRDLSVDEVVISIATAGRRTVSEILTRCEAVPVPTKIIPSLQEIVEGRVSISQFREVRIEDLLGRKSVDVTEFGQEVQQAYTGKRILVTGAGGSIGSELVRQLMLFQPHSMALVDKDENSSYELQQELAFRYPDAHIEPRIADIRHPERLQAIFEEFAPEVVFHAAAHKHVPLMEKQPCEAVLNNVFGTRTLLETCRKHQVERLIFISTDKAVNPTNVMGATKRVGELLVRHFAKGGSLPSASVRFGNVLGSRGSVIPLFQKQIREGGPITVTHADVVRFFMTIPEAVQLVMCAGSFADHGEIFVLDMGNPRNIMDLACEMIRLAGLEPQKDVEIVITGLRPGEKLVEELVGTNEKISPTRIENLSVITSDSIDEAEFLVNVDYLLQAARRNDSRRVYEILCQMDLGFSPAAVKTSDSASN